MTSLSLSRKKTIAIIVAIVVALIGGAGAYFMHRVDNSLSEVPRADLLPEQVATTTVPLKTFSESATPTPSATKKSSSPTPTVTKRSTAMATRASVPAPVTEPKPIGSTIARDEYGNVIAKNVPVYDPNSAQKFAPVYNGVAAPVNGAQTYLLLGSDARSATERGRSDSIMLMYVNGAHDKTYLISFPRDLYVNIPGYKKQKINAAYQYGGAALTTATVQNLTGIKVQHAAMVNFDGFTRMVDAVGGVTVNNPISWYDSQLKKQWNAGPLNLNSSNALDYVRSRHGLPYGDINRAQNQQRVMKALISKMVSTGTITDPNRLLSVIDGVSKTVVVDRSLDNRTILTQAMSLRNAANDTRSVVAPISRFASISGVGSVDIINTTRMAELRRALATDTMDAYYAKYANARLVG